jgi:BirA family biotin operon repressor/biotin-[acetyl-CoA-carboxylase] ligase
MDDHTPGSSSVRPAGAATHLSWGAEKLWQTLQPLLPGIGVEVLARAGSTNALLLDRARLAGGRRASDDQPTLLVAEHQTQGRGRQGREWQAAPGASLTFSLALPLAPAADWSGLSLAVGVALADALEPAPAGPPRVGLKWPNDLFIVDAPGRGRKLGGILVEALTQGARRTAVVGVGLNVLPQPTHGLTHGYACVQEIDAAASAPALLALVAAPLVRALKRFEAEGFAPFAAAYARRDLLRGQPVTASAAGPGDAVDGIAEGVDADGALLLREGPRLHRIVAGEVSVRLRGAPAAPEPPAC